MPEGFSSLCGTCGHAMSWHWSANRTCDAKRGLTMLMCDCRAFLLVKEKENECPK